MNTKPDRRLLRLCITLMLACLCAAQVKDKVISSPLEPDDLRVAGKAVLVSLAVGASVAGNTLCSEKPVACAGPTRIELAVSLIGARNSPASLDALAQLVRYRLGGAYYEQYEEEVADKGARIQRYLASVSPKHLHENCRKELSSLIQTSGSMIGQVREEEVCRTEQEIADKLRSLSSGRIR